MKTSVELGGSFLGRRKIPARARLPAAVVAIAAYVLMTEALVRVGHPTLLAALGEGGAYFAFGLGALACAQAVEVEVPWRLRGHALVATMGVLLAAVVLLVALRLHAVQISSQAVHSVYPLRFAITGGLIVPFTEEVLFRGLFEGALERSNAPSRIAQWAPILVTASIFGVLHWPSLYGQNTSLGPLIVLSAFVSGVVFGYLRVRLQTIAPGMALHALGNLAGF